MTVATHLRHIFALVIMKISIKCDCSEIKQFFPAACTCLQRLLLSFIRAKALRILNLLLGATDFNLFLPTVHIALQEALPSGSLQSE